MTSYSCFTFLFLVTFLNLAIIYDIIFMFYISVFSNLYLSMFPSTHGVHIYTTDTCVISDFTREDEGCHFVSNLN